MELSEPAQRRISGVHYLDSGLQPRRQRPLHGLRRRHPVGHRDGEPAACSGDITTPDGQGWASLGTFALPSPLAPLPGGEGNTLTVSLSDNADGIVVADAVRLAVVDLAPTVLSTAPVNVPQGTTDSSLNLASVFNNPNGPLSQLTFTVETNSNSALVPAAWVEDQTLEFAAAPGLSGTSNITILATDPAGESVQATIPIVVAPSPLPAAPSALTANPVSASEIDLTWTNNAGSGTTFQVQRATNSSFTQNLTTVMTTAADATSCSNTGLNPNTTYYYRVLATNAAGNSPASNTATAATQALSTLPAGWSDANVGGPSPAGSASCTNNVYTVSGGGADIWNAADQFNYCSQPVCGDQTLIARVTYQSNTNGWAKAGVMFRDSTAAGAMCVDLVATPSNGVSLQWRNAAGGSSSTIQVAGVGAPSASHPVWLKLVKNGSNYAGYYSLNGTSWTEVGSTVVTFSNAEYLAGLAVDSHNNGVLGTATFDNVSVTASLPSGWTDADIGAPSPAGAASCSASNVYTLTGGGADIYGTSDQFNYAWQTLPGDGTIIAQVTSQTNSNGWAKAGVMIRSSNSASSNFVAVEATPSSGTNVQYRNSAYPTGNSVAAGNSNTWLKLVRSGGNVTAYQSSNGTTWTQIGSAIALPTGSALVGLAVTSHNNGTASTATFANVSVTGLAAPVSAPLPSGWSDADIGSLLPAGSATFVPSTSGGGAGGEGSGVYTVTGGGGDIWNAADEFNFASQTASGDQTLIARVTSETDVSSWSKAGVMFRDMLPSTAGGGAGGEGSSAGAMFVDVVATPGNSVSMQWRSATGGQCAMATLSGVGAPTASAPCG